MAMTETTPTSAPDRSLAAARPDLIHPFQCRPGEETRCSYFHTWLGGQVMCGMRESAPIHHNGPHLLRAADGEQAYCKGSVDTCEACFQDSRLEKLTDEMQDRQRSLRRIHDMSGAEFGEAIAD